MTTRFLEDTSNTQKSDFLAPVSAFIAVVVLTFLCYLPDLKNDLLYFWDDAGYIRLNTYIRSISIETVRWAFTSFWCNFWAPLTWLSLALDYAIWGLNPIGYHLTNNILHALNAGMFFYLSLELFTVRRAANRSQGSECTNHYENVALWCSLLAALFFSIHPLRVESVAWAAERKDVLSLFFGIPAVFAYLKHARFCLSQPESIVHRFYFFAFSPYYWLAFVFFCLSLLSKPMLVTLPVVLLILDWYPIERVHKMGMQKIIAEKIIFFIVSVIVALISMAAQKPQMMSLETSDIFSRILNAAKSIVSYLWLTVWPVDINPFYVHPGNIPVLTPEYAFSVIFVITVTVSCIVLAKRHPFFLVVWLLYLATLFPILGFTQVGPQAMAARFTYAPSLPISLFVAVIVSAPIFRHPTSRLSVVMMSSIISLIVLFWCCVTVRHISFWKNDVTLWTRVIDLNPQATGRAYFQRSHAYNMRGEHMLALADLNRALDIAKQKKYRALHEIYQVRAQILDKMENYNGAIADYTRALETATAQEQPMLYMARGEVYQRIGETARAAEDIRRGNGKF
jgi:hypothetical protein